MRISLFGGSTDYKSFYENNGAFIIGSTINKYAYSTIRFRPSIVGEESVIKYSKMEVVKNTDEIQNILIRETLKYYGINRPVELVFDADVPTRTGLGGSSSYCAALAQSICILLNLPFNPTKICSDVIKIERDILKEPGGIQDQIWACHGGFKCIIINRDGSYTFEPVPGSMKFHSEFKKSLVLIYSKKQRELFNVQTPAEDGLKLKILDTAKKAKSAFESEDIKSIGELLYQTWIVKRNLTANTSDETINQIIDNVMNMGAYGAKLLGNGSAGFVLVVCNPHTKKLIQNAYDGAILNFQFSKGSIMNKSI